MTLEGYRRSTAVPAACILAVAIAFGFPLHVDAATDTEGSIVMQGVSRTYTLHVPPLEAPQTGFPLILAFHGGGGQARSMRRLTGFDELADKLGFIVAYPNGIDRHWNDGRSTIKNPVDDVSFVSALIDRLQAERKIDPHRIFAAGMSNGAMFSERLACDLSNKISAIAAISGQLPVDYRPRCKPANPISVMQIGGTSDPIVPYDGGHVADFGGRGEGGTVLSVEATANFWARNNGCKGGKTQVEMPHPRIFDKTRIRQERYADCPSTGRVVVYTVEDGGHAWPGGPQYLPAVIVGRASRQMDASSAIADFFFASQP